MLSLMRYIFISLQGTKDHEGNDQSIQADTFGKTYEDEDLPRMEPSSLMAPRAADAAADTAIPPPRQAHAGWKALLPDSPQPAALFTVLAVSSAKNA